LIVVFLWNVLPGSPQLQNKFPAVAANLSLSSIAAIAPSASSAPQVGAVASSIPATEQSASSVQALNKTALAPASAVSTNPAPVVASTPSIDKENIAKPHVKKTKSPASIPADDTTAKLNAASKMLASKNYAAAISLANEVLKKHPGNARAQEITKQADNAQLSPSIWPR
jgi:hypothetical protein